MTTEKRQSGKVHAIAHSAKRSPNARIYEGYTLRNQSGYVSAFGGRADHPSVNDSIVGCYFSLVRFRLG